jgi:hypothetical protein
LLYITASWNDEKNIDFYLFFGEFWSEFIKLTFKSDSYMYWLSYLGYYLPDVLHPDRISLRMIFTIAESCGGFLYGLTRFLDLDRAITRIKRIYPPPLKRLQEFEMAYAHFVVLMIRV